MKKYYYLLFVLLAVFSWQFLDVRLGQQHTVSVGLSASSSVAFAQGANTSLPGSTGSLTSVLGNSSLPWFNELYGFSRGLLNIILLAFLVYIAFRNILNISVENYAIKKILPKIVFAAFLGNLIKPIMTIASRIVDSIIISQTTIFHTPSSMSWYTTVNADIGETVINMLVSTYHLDVTSILALLGEVLGLVLAALNWGITALIIIIIQGMLLVGTLVIGFFHSLAPWVVVLATAIGPIAIGLSILPETESAFKKWTKIIIFWLAFPLILNAISYLFGIIPTLKGVSDTSVMSRIIATLLPLLIKIGLFAFAIRMPFTWEKDISGLVAALPGQAAKGFKSGLAVADKSKHAQRFLWERKRDLGMKPNLEVAKLYNNGTLGRRAEEWLGSDAGKAESDKRRASGLRGRLGRDKGAMKNIFNADNIENISEDQVLEYLTQYDTGQLDQTRSEDVAAQSFFDTNNPEVEKQVQKRLKGERLTKEYNDEHKTQSDTMKAGWKYRALEYSEQKIAGFIPGLVRGYTENVESNEKEANKEVRRNSGTFRGELGNKYLDKYLGGAANRYVRGSAEDERISSDMSRIQTSAALWDTYKKSPMVLLRNFERVYADSSLPENERKEQTKLLMNSFLEDLNSNGENMKGYDIKMAALQDGWDDSTSLETTLNIMKPFYLKFNELTNREARAYKSIEEQQELMNQKKFEYYDEAWGGGPSTSPRPTNPSSGGGAPSASPRPTDPSSGGGAPSGSVGDVGPNSPATAPSGHKEGESYPIGGDNEQLAAGLSNVSQQLKAVNDSVQGVRQQIRTTTGTPLQRMNTLLGQQGRKALSEGQLDEMGDQTEQGLNNISEILTQKKPTDPAAITNFEQQLESSGGYSTPEIISDAHNEFYPERPNGQINPYASDLIVNVEANELAVERSRMGGEQNKIILDLARKIPPDSGAKAQILQSIQVVNNNEASPSTIAPQALQQAQQAIATHAGLPKDTPLTTKMVNDIHRALQAGMVDDPTKM